MGVVGRGTYTGSDTVGVLDCDISSEGVSGERTIVGRGNNDGLGWLACSRAVAKAWMLRKRCCGSFARAISTTCSTSEGMVGTFVRKGGGEANICWLTTSVK